MTQIFEQSAPILLGERHTEFRDHPTKGKERPGCKLKNRNSREETVKYRNSREETRTQKLTKTTQPT
jgi:hypothetical protein